MRLADAAAPIARWWRDLEGARRRQDDANGHDHVALADDAVILRAVLTGATVTAGQLNALAQAWEDECPPST